MTDGISAALPVTDGRRSVAPAEWLRAAVVAAVAAAALATLFDLTVAERVVDRAVAAEDDHGHAATGVPEPFTRTEQRGGLVLAELVYALGAALVLAGAATLLGPARAPERRWLWLAAAVVWSLVVVPAVAVPPLPPGAESELAIGERRLAYAAAVVLGAAGAGGAAVLFRRLALVAAGWRMIAAAAILAGSAATAVAALPGDDLAEPLPAGLVRDFRVVSIAGQVMLWGTLALVGAALLRGRAREG